MKVSVIGAGGWGTALAIQSMFKNYVTLWVYCEEELNVILEHGRENYYYLPGIKIPESIKLTTDVSEVIDSDIIIFVVPSKFFRNTVRRFSNIIKKETILVSATKGFEFPGEKRMSEILKEETGGKNPVAVLSGPSHAEEVVRCVPTSVVVASDNEDSARIVQEALSNENFRLYFHTDVIGVEICGALKNVIAIAAGMLRGFGLGDNTMAALITRGLAEIRRAGIKLGGKLETFAGLAGIGDLIVTCMSRHSRNGRVGELLASGKRLQEILSEMKMVAEGVETSKCIPELEKNLQIEMPISRMVYEVLYQNLSPENGLKSLMNRPLKHEYL